MIEKMLDRPDPIDEIYVDKGGFVSDGTICQELREIYHMVDDEEAKIKIRVAMAMAKKIIRRLFMYRNGEIGWECRHCGDCCNRINFGIDARGLDKDTKDLLGAHGVSFDGPFCHNILPNLIIFSFTSTVLFRIIFINCPAILVSLVFFLFTIIIGLFSSSDFTVIFIIFPASNKSLAISFNSLPVSFFIHPISNIFFIMVG